MDNIDLERLICWAKYLYWAELQRNSFRKELYENNSSGNQQFLAKMSLWYASLYVVVEAWALADLNDPVINKMINDNKSTTNTLRRFRNSVYHYQDSIFESKYLEFLQLGTKSIYWIEALHEEFKSYLGKLPSKLMSDSRLAHELRQSLKDVIGWFPDDTVELRKQNLEVQIEQGKTMLEASGDYSSPQAIKLITTLSQIQELLKNTPDKPIKDLFDSNKM